MLYDCSDLRILVVDDSAHMRRIIRQLLHGLGIRDIYEADDGAAGITIFQDQSPDIILTDWIMPVFDGIELTRMARNRETSVNPYVPIIMMTGLGARSKVMQARDAGVNEFLVKPISAKQLYLRIQHCIEKPRAFVKTSTYFGPDRRRFIQPNYTGENRRATDHESNAIALEDIDQDALKTDPKMSDHQDSGQTDATQQQAGDKDSVFLF